MSSRLDVLVVPAGVPGHVLQFREGLDAGEPAAHERERQQTLAQLGIQRAGREVEPGQHVVAQVDRLADGLERDAALGQPRYRQQPGHRAQRHDEHVVADLLQAACHVHGDHPPGVLDLLYPAADDVAAPQRRAQRHHHAARLDGTGGRLRQERLVGHVRLRVDPPSRTPR